MSSEIIEKLPALENKSTHIVTGLFLVLNSENLTTLLKLHTQMIFVASTKEIQEAILHNRTDITSSVVLKTAYDYFKN